MKKAIKICIAVLLLVAFSLPVSAQTYDRGDVNGDGKVTSVDYAMVKRYVLLNLQLNEEQQKAADVNGDGRVDPVDYILIKRFVMMVGTFPCLHEYDETVVGNLHIFTCKTCGHQYEEFDGQLIG